MRTLGFQNISCHFEPEVTGHQEAISCMTFKSFSGCLEDYSTKTNTRMMIFDSSENKSVFIFI